MRASPVTHAALLARTLRDLRPAQVAHRLRLRGLRALTGRFPGAAAARLRQPVPADPRWPAAFVPVDGRLAEGLPGPEENAGGTFRFLGCTRTLGTPADWAQADAEQLWRYHLHYFDWAWSFAAHPDRQWALEAFAALWESWATRTTFGAGDAWAPYVASLRAWTLCGVHGALMAGTGVEAGYLAEVGLHAGFVRANRELDVGGNHLLKNLKALVGLGVFFDDGRLLHPALRQLEEELAVQVLADGGHYERSPSYHCQVLGDLIDVHDLLAASGRTPPGAVEKAIDAMRRWLGTMLLPDGDVPLFNDCTLVGARRLSLLEPVAPPPSRLTVLQPSGYVVVRPDDTLHLVGDVGPPCPPHLPAHAHADCLSFELAVHGRRVVVDTGTSTYQAPDRRAYERSTAAHNTVEVDGADQTEVWGTFRAARKATPVLETAHDDGETIVVRASHDGYERLPGRPRHRRTWRATAGRIEVVDDVDGSGRHRVVASLHVAPGVEVEEARGGLRVGPLVVSADSADLEWHPVEVATDFGSVATGAVLQAARVGELPIRLSARLRVEEAG